MGASGAHRRCQFRRVLGGGSASPEGPPSAQWKPYAWESRGCAWSAERVWEGKGRARELCPTWNLDPGP
eukprot:10660580-Alexandrium_andersonii.AAC.1